LPAVLLFFTAAGLVGADQLEASVELCTRPREWHGPNGRSAPIPVPMCVSERVVGQLEELLVGRHVTRIFAGTRRPVLVDGTIVRLKSAPPSIQDGTLVVDASIEYEAVYEGAPGGVFTITYSQEEAQAAATIMMRCRTVSPRRAVRSATRRGRCTNGTPSDNVAHFSISACKVAMLWPL